MGDVTDTDDSDARTDALGTIANGAAWVFGGRLVKLAIAFLTHVIVARVLGMTSYGSVVIALMVFGVATMFGDLGIDTGISRNLPHYEDEPAKARGVLWSGLVLTVTASITTAVLMFLTAPLLASVVFHDPSLVPLFRVVAFAIPFAVLVNVGISIAKGSRDARSHVYVNQIVGPIFGSVTKAGLVLLGFGAIGAVAAPLVTNLLLCGLSLYLAWCAVRIDLRGHVESMYREMLEFSLPLLFARNARFISANTDLFFLGVFLTSGAAGLYNVVFQLSQVGMIFFYPATFLVQPMLTRLLERDEDDAVIDTYRSVSKWTTFLTVPVFLLVVFFPTTIIDATFGSQYLAATPALQILMIPILITNIFGANGEALLSFGHNRIQLVGESGAALVNVILNILLIPRYGVVGAAAATTTGFVFRDVAFTVALHRWHGVHPFSGAMLKPTLTTFAFAPVGYLLFIKLFPITLVTVTVLGIVFLCLYVPLVVVSGGIESMDERLLSQFERSIGTEFTRLRTLLVQLRGLS